MDLPKFKKEIIKDKQTAFNIAKQIKRAIEESQPSAKKFAHNFNWNDREELCKELFKFTKRNVKYERESSLEQSAQTINRIFYHKKGDCKHYSIVIASFLKALGIPCKLRLISQNYYDKEPTHIYVVAKDERGRDIIVDACLRLFNNEARYNYKYDIKL